MSYQFSSIRDNTQEEFKPNLADIKFSFPEEQQEKLQDRLTEYPLKDDISKRAAFGGSQVSYIEGWKIFQIANEIFGFNGWSTSIMNSTVDFLDIDDGRYSVGISTVIRVTLKDGSFHEDVGYGMMENAKSKGQAFEKARKESVTDAVKRALRFFGNSLGNCLYDKQFLKKASKAPSKDPQEFGMNGNSSKSFAFGFNNNVPSSSTNGFGLNSNSMQHTPRPGSFNQGVSNTNSLQTTFRPGTSNQVNQIANSFQNAYRPGAPNQFSPGMSSNITGPSISHGVYLKSEVLTPAQNFGLTAQPGSSGSIQPQPLSNPNPDNGTSRVLSTNTTNISSNLREDSFDLDDESFDQITTESLTILNKTSNNNQIRALAVAAPDTSSSNQIPNTGNSSANNYNMGPITMASSFISAGSLKVASPLASRTPRTPTNQNLNPMNQASDNLPDSKRHRGC